MQRLLPALVAVAVLFAASSARAQVSMSDVARELRKKKVRPVKVPIAHLALGFHGDIAFMGEARLGFGWGTYADEFLVPTVKLWRVTLAARGAYGREDSIAASALFGRSRVSLLGWQLEAGIDTRLDPDDRNVGPIVALAMRVGPVGLHGNTWVHLLDETDWGWSIALGWTLFDSKKPIIDPAKDRAEEAAEEYLKDVLNR